MRHTRESILSATRERLGDKLYLSAREFDSWNICGSTTVCRRWGSWRAFLAELLGVDETELRRRERAAQHPPEERLAIPEGVAPLLKDNRRLRKELERERDRTQVFRELVEATAAHIKPARQARPPRPRKTDHTEWANLCLGDMQIGTYFESEETSGRNVYSYQMFRKNLDVLNASVSQIIQWHQKMYRIPRLNIWGYGDYVEGELNFPGQQLHIDRVMIDQAWRGAHDLAVVVASWATLFDELHLFLVIGNHGRSGRRRGEAHRRSSWDLCFCYALRSELRDISNVTVHISSSPLMAVGVMSHRVLLSHGNETMAWNQIPFYGLSRDALKQQAMLGKTFDLKISGHHHVPAQFDVADPLEVIEGGSWIGGSPFSAQRMKSVLRPSQFLFGMSRRHACTWRYKLHLHALQELAADGDGIYTPVEPEMESVCKEEG